MSEQEDGLDQDAMHSLYAKTLYSLRETRKALLKQYGVADEPELLAKIRDGETGEQPAYDHYLGALIIEQTRMQLRSDIMTQMSGTEEPATTPEVSIHLAFKELLEVEYGDRMTEPVRMAQDALLLSFDTGLMMEVRYFSAREYSIRWSWGEAEFCIDTAPVFGEVTTPSHLHLDDGSITADPLTSPGKNCWSNFSQLLDSLLDDPLLERKKSEQAG